MASGFEGWIALFEEDSVVGSTLYQPQPLHADQESLSLNKEILHKTPMASPSRVSLGDTLVYKAAKPQGEVAYQFRSDDILKVLLAHFQAGSVAATTTPYRYTFFPRMWPLDYTYRGTIANSPYGQGSASRVYSVAVGKKLFDTTQNGGTNAYLFKHGICDKLSLSIRSGDDARAKASFKFTDCDAGTAISANPSGTAIGTYSVLPSYESWSGTMSMDGGTFEMSSLTLVSDQGVQEFSRVGKSAPENFQYSSYSLKGQIGFDLPQDAFRHVGSMVSGEWFSISGTFANSVNDRVIVSIPRARRLPFDYFNHGGDKTLEGMIPFEAFEYQGSSPITISVDTNSIFSGLLRFGDALTSSRSGVTMQGYDAGTGARDNTYATIIG